jgi:hypothetical protein
MVTIYWKINWTGFQTSLLKNGRVAPWPSSGQFSALNFFVFLICKLENKLVPLSL